MDTGLGPERATHIKNLSYRWIFVVQILVAPCCIMSHPTLAYPSHVNSIGDFNFNCADLGTGEIKDKRRQKREQTDAQEERKSTK